MKILHSLIGKTMLVFSFVILISIHIFSQPVYFTGKNRTGMRVNVLNSTTTSTTLEYIFDGVHYQKIVIDGEEYSFLSAPGMVWFMDQGYPQLPISRSSIVIPDLAAMNYKIVAQDVETIETLPVIPSKGHFTRDIDPQSVPYTFAPVYKQDTWFPSETILLDEPYIVRDLRGMTIQFNPVQFNPAQKQLRIWKRIVVEVYTDNRKEVVNPFNREKPFRGITSEFEDIYTTLFSNYGKGAFEYTPIPEPGRLLIIYHQNYASQIQPLNNWKIEKGIPTLLAEYPTQTGTGSAAIKTYIQNLYNQAEGLTYIVLVGESDQIPYLTGNYESAASDPCYVKLSGTDAYPDAYISRISPSSQSNCAYIISKIIKYEKYPDTGADAGWYFKGTGVASDESGSTPLIDWQRMNLVRDTLLAHGFVHVDQIYDPSASSAAVTAAINDGRSILNYMGHGSGTSWSTTGFNVTAIHNLSNGWKNPFIIDVACQNGKFTLTECMEEAWIRAGDTTNPKGAIAVYGASTNTSWVPPCDMQTEAIYLLANKLRNTVGGISFNGVMKAMDLWGGSTGEGLKLMEQYNIFGDCSMVMNFGVTPDSTAPTTIADLSVTNPTSNSLTLQWSAPLDSTYGGVTSYDIRRSTTPINENNFSGCAQILLGGQNDSPGTQKSYMINSLDFGTQYYFAIKSKDLWGNTSEISNNAMGSTLAAPVCTVSMDSIFHQIVTGNQIVDSIVIANVSATNSTLNYEVELTNNTFPSKSVEVKVVPVQTKTIDAKTDEKEFPSLAFGSSIEGFGGPDTFGYEWIDSDETGGPQYVWNDIVATGTAVTNWTATGTFSATDEGYAGPFNLGFNFKFYGVAKNQIYIGSNGFLTFSPVTANSFTNAQIPNASVPNDLISPFWDDLDAKAPGTVHYKQDGNKFIIQWTNYQRYSGTASYTFQVVLYSSGKIMVYYKEMTGTINSTSVGIENSTGSVGLQVAYNATYVKNNLALQISAEPEWLISSNNSGTIYSGNSAAVLLNFLTTELEFGNYSMDMVINTNDPQNQTITIPVRMVVSNDVPVELTSLNIDNKSNNVILSWTTATETNNKGFEIERKSKEIWEKIAFVEGKGSTTETQSYQFIDKDLKPAKYQYRLKQIDFDGTVSYSSIIEGEVAAPDKFDLSQNYPNPFNPLTVINYQLPVNSFVTLKIYDVLGNEIKTVVNENQEAGTYKINFDGSSLTSGMYIYKLTANGFTSTKKMMLLK